ncbi:hypothetical protein [Streptomyces nymphaeiformis]|jgi:hypothetical protein|uniref:Uncharacterized protein n=1 Tax=Streptomyces nymphaeiformis TaxID=2663842 RepID=A0A7W7XGI4_9ACTN|nr:hypothetical protein [Streptomyces nymphaeiformis]MBB4987500.1 hypothetical protein [Streptomyces nymphaeiformis]
MVALPPPDLFELYYNGQFNNRTSDVRASAGVTMSRGVSAEGTRADPSAADMLLNNRHGDYSRRNPMSALYGKIGPNTPMRYSVDAGYPYLLLPGDTSSALTTPDAAVLGVTDLDIRIEVALDSYTTAQEAVSRFLNSGNNCSWSLQVGNGLQLSWYPDGSFASQKTAGIGVQLPAIPRQRIAFRVVLDVNTGAGGHLVSFYWAPSITATMWNPLGTATAGTGTTTVFDGAAGLQLGTNTGLVGTGLKGRIYAFQLWDGATGVRKVNVDFSTAKAGDTSFTDTGGLVWTKAGAAALANRHVRMAGEVPAWTPQRDASGADRTVPITPAGITRRLDAGTKPLESALLRYLRAAGPIECWPLIDGAQATSGAPLVGTAPAVVLPGSTYVWADGELADWIEPVIHLTGGGRIIAPLPAHASAATGWSVDWPFSQLDSLVTCSVTEGSATGRTWTVSLDPSTNKIQLFTFTAAGATTLQGEISPANVFNDVPHVVRLTTASSGGSVGWSLYLDGVLAVAGADTPAAVPLQNVDVLAGLSGSFKSMALGYITYWGSSAPSAADFYRALTGFQGETAGARFLRLCTEQGVPAALMGTASATTPLGVQKREKFLDALASLARADGGYVLEQRDDRALAFRPRQTLYNQPPAITLDFSTGVISEPFRPLDDEKLSENDVAVTREGGTFASAVQLTGPLSVQDPPAGIGRYDVAHTLSLAADAQALQQAAWRLHVGTVDGLRYPQITLDLGNPRVWPLIRAVYLADVGDKIRLTGLPDDYGPDDVDLIIRGYKETVTEKTWRITFTCTPGAPYDVLQLGAPAYSRLATAGSQLASAITATATSLSVTTTGTTLWTTAAGDRPFDIVVGGERMTVTNLTGATSPQTFTVTRSVNGVVKSHVAGTALQIARPVVYAL